VTVASRAARIGGPLCAVALLAGCTSTSAGQPLPTAPATSRSSPNSESNGSTSGSTPARPREIRLDGTNPCDLLPETEWPKFHIERPGKLGQEPTFKSPECFYSTNVAAFVVVAVNTEGINRWTDGSRRAVVEEVEPVEGFPAISITRREDKNQCDIAVDVAAGQYLLAGALLVPGDESLPERCDYAHQLAESAMKTLVKA
jgi:uncharacterized protein DUF3558